MTDGTTTREMTGGRAVAEMVALTRPGPIFGMGGFQLLPFYDGVRALGLNHVLVNDESSDLLELDYAGIARAYGCRGIRVEEPGQLGPALAAALAENAVPVVLDVVVTRDPAQMLPAVDSRLLAVTPGDRPV